MVPCAKGRGVGRAGCRARGPVCHDRRKPGAVFSEHVLRWEPLCEYSAVRPISRLVRIRGARRHIEVEPTDQKIYKKGLWAQSGAFPRMRRRLITVASL